MTPLPLDAPDRQARWAPVWLVEFTDLSKRRWVQSDFVQSDFVQRGVAPSVPSRYASLDVVAGGQVYHGRVLSAEVSRALPDAEFGGIVASSATVVLANADGAVSALYDDDVRQHEIVLSRYDRETATTIVQLRGVVAHVERAESTVVLRCVSPDTSVLEELLPRGAVTAATFTAKAVDVNVPIPVIFGNVERHWCPYVNDDTVSDQYDYLVGRGALTITAVYRDGGVAGTFHAVDASEYAVETTRYAGMTTLRFTNRQVNFQNAFHRLYADVTGLAAERNFARAIRTLLSDATYGLGQTVDAAGFDAAEAALDAVGGLYCDAAFGGALGRRQAQDFLKLLVVARGIRLALDGAGAWTPTVDAAQATAALALRDGAGAGERTLVAVRAPLQRVPTESAAKTLVVRYRWDPVAGYRLEVSRAVHGGYGADVVIETPFVRDSTTADKIAEYVGKRLRYGDTLLSVEATEEARQVDPGDVVQVTSAPLGLTAVDMEVRAVERRGDAVGLALRGWDADAYTYAAGTLPTEPTVPVTAPSFGSNLSFPSLGYRSVYDVQALSFPGSREAWASVVAAVNVASGRLTVYVQGNTDGAGNLDAYWGQVHQDSGTQAIALGVKFAYAAVRMFARGVNDTSDVLHLVGRGLNGDTMAYARLSGDGTIEQAWVDKITIPAGVLRATGLARYGSLLYWVWAEMTPKAIYFASSDLSGTVVTGRTKLADWPFSDMPPSTYVGVDGSGVGYAVFGYAEVSNWRAGGIKFTSTGTVLATAAPLDSVSASGDNNNDFVVGAWVTAGVLYALYCTAVAGSTGYALRVTKYSLEDLSVLDVSAVTILADPDIAFQTFAVNRDTGDLFLVRVPIETGSPTALKIARLTRTLG